MRIAVVGAGISGLVAAQVLVEAGVEVVLYEKENYLGGHAKTVNVNDIELDLGFMVFNRVTYPNMMEWFEKMGVEMERSDMSLSVSLDRGKGCEWGTRNGLSSLFAQKSNACSPYFWQMLREILKFKHDALAYLEKFENNPDLDRNESLGDFIISHGYSQLFHEAYLIPICGCFWSCPAEGVLRFSAFSVLSFCRNHHLLQLFGRPQLLTVRGRSRTYTTKIKEELEKKNCHIKLGCEVQFVSTAEGACCVFDINGSQEMYDGCIMATHAPDALRILGSEANNEERRVLGAFQYVYSDIYLHHDKNFMPQNPSAWSAWNFLGTVDKKVCVTYWLNVIQNIDDELPFLVTLNPHHTPENTLHKWSTSHPIPSVAATKASLELTRIQGKRGIWFCGAYQGYGFHEDGLKAGIIAANTVLGKACNPLINKLQMVPSWVETGARLVVTRFLDNFISIGCIILLEDGGTIFTFEGTNTKYSFKSVLRIHHPTFYWKVASQADLGLADSYINGDFSFIGEKEDLLNLFLIFIANRDFKYPGPIHKNKRGWWTPMLFTVGIASAKYYYRHMLRKNTLTQARQNISRHYDLSNDLFSMFLDETMTYSCAIFKNHTEDLKVAQLRKISILIEKARIESKHEILEIGCGWGSLAIEVVRRTGCNYTGITLSNEQLKYAEKKVKEAGLQDKIKFLLTDYRQVASSKKFDRIISCEMLEAVGHEYMEEFFGCCESILAEDGLFVLQFISIPDEQYEEHRRTSGFITEYIFPGGCLPSLSRVTSAMASASRLCVEHLENIGIHYYQTLMYWRDNFMAKQSKIIALGFDEKFIRTWEYYFVYCAAGFKSRTLGDYQIVFSRPRNLQVFGDPYKGLPSAY